MSYLVIFYRLNGATKQIVAESKTVVLEAEDLFALEGKINTWIREQGENPDDFWVPHQIFH